MWAGFAVAGIRTFIWWAGDLQTVQQLVEDRVTIGDVVAHIVLSPWLGPAITTAAVVGYVYLEHWPRFSRGKEASVPSSAELHQPLLTGAARVDAGLISERAREIAAAEIEAQQRKIAREVLIDGWRAMVTDIHKRTLEGDDIVDDATVRQWVAAHPVFLSLHPYLSDSVMKIVDGHTALVYSRSMPPTIHPILEQVAREIDRLEQHWKLRP